MSSGADVRVVGRSRFVDLVYGTFALYWRRLPFLALVSAVVWIPAFLIQLVVAFALGVPGAITSIQPNNSTANSSAVHSLIPYIAVVLAVMIAAGTLSQGALIRGASDAVLRGSDGVRTALRAALSAFWRLLAMLVVLAVLIVIAGVALALVFALIIDAAGLLGGTSQLPAIALLFLVSLVLPLLVFARVLVAIPVTVLEGMPVISALRRGYELVTGRYLPNVLLVIVVSLIGWLISSVVSSLLAPTTGLGPGGSLVVADIGAVVLAVVLGPLPAAMLVTSYLESLPPGSGTAVLNQAPPG